MSNTMNKQKVIFLDFDGVLQIEQYDDPWMGNSSLKEGYTDRDQYGFLFDKTCVDHLGQLITKTDAGVVISSSWRYCGLDVMLEMWEQRQLPGELLGIIPLEDASIRLSRGGYIQQWLDANPVDAYVILDDVDDMLDNQRENLVLTDYKLGFQKDKLEAALRVLNK